AIKNGEQVIGSRTRVKVVKNKVAPPFREVEFDIMYGSGISREGDVLDLAVADNLVEKSGSWFAFDGERIGQGREQAKDFLKEHPEALAKLEAKLFEKAGVRRTAVPELSVVPPSDDEAQSARTRGRAKA
ncbi:MAG: recombinase RecA, partial [Deltaproteobacteria bacterium]